MEEQKQRNTEERQKSQTALREEAVLKFWKEKETVKSRGK